MITILLDSVEHVVTTSKYSKELNFLCVCFVTFMFFFIRRQTPRPREFFRLCSSEMRQPAVYNQFVWPEADLSSVKHRMSCYSCPLPTIFYLIGNHERP